MDDKDKDNRPDQPPAYDESNASDLAPDVVDHEQLGIDFAELDLSGPEGDSRARVTDDGTIDMWLDVTKPLPPIPRPPPPRHASHAPLAVDVDCPPLNIVIFVVGSRGDVQPYLALAIRLIKSHGHTVRLATHSAFKELVLSGNEHLGASKFGDLSGRLQHFDVGGNPHELMAFMVKNPGLMPGFESLTNGDIGSKRRMIKEMLEGFAAACHEPSQKDSSPFAADVIIANPPSFAGIHLAEALGLPLIMSFTMPWTPTQRFSHPLVNVQRSNAGDSVTNYLSYALADTLIWQGVGDVINRFRSTLGITPLSALTGPMATERLRVPTIYGWSPSLLPKPDEWRDNIDVVGFLAMPTTVSYTPSAELSAFLSSGPAPIYIGFGSIVVKDPDALTSIILEAVKATGVRALLSAGWSDLGGIEIPDTVFLLGDIPHDWLFAEGRVAAVCHHGGAGTTAAGLRAGLPTIIVPFFGDQLFWGTAVSQAGAGPAPIPYKKLNVDKLASAIDFALSDSARSAAASIGASIRDEDGTQAAVARVQANLPLEVMRCDVDPTRAAQWWYKKHWMRLSNAAAGALIKQKVISWDDLRPLRVVEYETDKVYTEPVTAITESFLSTTATGMVGSAQLFSKRPDKGLTKLSWGMVKGGGQIVNSLHQGLDNLPGMMGSRVRPRPRIDGIGSGLAEGGKQLAHGLADGVTGLVTEPRDGYQRGGIGGAVAGFGAGLGNLYFRPMAGLLGLLVLPSVGAYRSIQEWKRKGGAFAAARRAQSEQASANLSQEKAAQLVLWFRQAAASEKTKARCEKEKQRKKEIAAANSLDDTSPEEARAMASRPWYEEIVPPPRRRSSRPSSPQEKHDSPKEKTEFAEVGPEKSRTPPPLPPRRPPKDGMPPASESSL